MDDEKFPLFQWSLARFYFLALIVYTLFLIIANWLAVLDILDPDNFIYHVTTYGGGASAFLFIDRCEKTYNSQGFLLGNGLGTALFFVYVLSFVGVSLGIEKLFEYTVDYLSWP